MSLSGVVTGYFDLSATCVNCQVGVSNTNAGAAVDGGGWAMDASTKVINAQWGSNHRRCDRGARFIELLLPFDTILRAKRLQLHGSKCLSSHSWTYPQHVRSTIYITASIQALLHVKILACGHWRDAAEHLGEMCLALVTTPDPVETRAPIDRKYEIGPLP